jgi:hypothetical protein
MRLVPPVASPLNFNMEDSHTMMVGTQCNPPVAAAVIYLPVRRSRSSLWCAWRKITFQFHSLVYLSYNSAQYEPVSQEATITFRWIRTRWIKNANGIFTEDFSIQPEEAPEQLAQLARLPVPPPGAPPRPILSAIVDSDPLRSIVPAELTGMEARAEMHVRHTFGAQLLSIIKNVEYSDAMKDLFSTTLTKWQLFGNDLCGVGLPLPPAYGATSRCLPDAVLARIPIGNPVVAVLPFGLAANELLREWEPRFKFFLQLLQSVKDRKHDHEMEDLFQSTMNAFREFSNELPDEMLEPTQPKRVKFG